MSAMRNLRGRIIGEEKGISALEWAGLVAAVIALIVFIPAVRSVFAAIFDATLGQKDDNGDLTSTAIALRGIAITIVSIVAFIGTGYLILYTDLGKRLAFLVTGAATFGWLIVGSMLFVVYAPRGLRPANLQGLNAFQIRIPAIALTLASLILFLMFVAALDRYEKENPDV
jgi:uncharacterized membrane protein